jgi:hypothetical protein
MNELINEFSLLELSKKINSVNKIQKWYKQCKKNICIKIKTIIEILNLHKYIMQKCFYEILLINKKFPPQKNENKFIYGKLVEKALLFAFSTIGFNCIELDKNHKIGSEYKNDIELLKIKFSIKAKLKKTGNVILINKKSSNCHNVNMNLIVCIIETNQIYLIPNSIVNKNQYLTSDVGTLSYKSSLFTMIRKKYNDYIYKFPNITYKQNKFILNQKEINIMDKLYETEIKSI